MNEEEIKKRVQHWISVLRNKGKVEESKVELKREWPLLQQSNSELRQIAESEFAKDLAAIANASGPGGLLIYGIGEDGTVFDAPFRSTGYRDHTDLTNLVVRLVDLPINFELKEVIWDDAGQGKTISVISIPPSQDKPHVIRCHLSKKNKPIGNYIPIKKDTGTWPASRSDIEGMFYDRKYIEPEYSIEMTVLGRGLILNYRESRELEADKQVVFQNTGRRISVIRESKLVILASPEQKIDKDLEFKGSDFSILNSDSPDRKYSFIIVPANGITVVRVKYHTGGGPELRDALKLAKELRYVITATDINEKVYRFEGVGKGT